jgi:hypothetical protein
MTVADALVGQVIEILERRGKRLRGTGRYYKIARACPIVGARTCYQQHTRLKVQVAPASPCRLVRKHIEGF